MAHQWPHRLSPIILSDMPLRCSSCTEAWVADACTNKHHFLFLSRSLPAPPHPPLSLPFSSSLFVSVSFQMNRHEYGNRIHSTFKKKKAKSEQQQISLMGSRHSGERQSHSEINAHPQQSPPSGNTKWVCKAFQTA